MERSEAQKRAQQKYYQTKLKARQKTISITLTPEQAEADRARIAAAGYTIGQFWRASVDALPQPAPAPQPAEHPADPAPADTPKE